jgi:radical SAM-linked protein
MKAQRLRIRYRLLPAACELRHRDIVTAWEEAARAAGLTISYSTGKRPAAQISLAAPLPQGATSDCELVDVYLAERVEPGEALRRLGAGLPPGLEATDTREVGVNAPSLQSALRWAEYEADGPAGGRSAYDVCRAIEQLLVADAVPAEYRRETKLREYDLRPLVLDIRLTGERDGAFRLMMRLRAEQDNTARADQVAIALGLPEPLRVHRTRLELDELPAGIQAYRRAGRPEGG